MTVSAPGDVVDALRSAAQERADGRRGSVRVVVQLDHVARAVGGAQVAAALRERLPDSAYVVIAGSDGADFQAPKVVVTTPDGGSSTFANVSTADADDVIRASSNGSEPRSDCDAFFDAQVRIALDGAGKIDAVDLDDYLLIGGYAGLANTLAMPPEGVIEEVKKSGLRGRGGAYFPAGLKWEGARRVNASQKYLVVNAEEGEPGIFKDRRLMESVPYRILEGMAIAAYAAGADRAHVYINAEAEISTKRMREAISRAHAAGLLGENILGTDFSLEVELRRGAGGYVCGEETTLLNTMEGRRREPRLRPPFPTESGLWAQPTVINNPETLCSVPFILANGAGAFSRVGSDAATGAKIISLSGGVRRPGVAEVPMGATLREIVHDIGGGVQEGHRLIGLATGGPSSGVFPPSMLDTPIAPGPMHESGVMLGAGGVIALDDRTTIPAVVRQLAAYNAAESCGKCTPCREGTPRIVAALDRLSSGEAPQQNVKELRDLAHVVGAASLCGLGQAAGGPVTSALRFFPNEMMTPAT